MSIYKKLSLAIFIFFVCQAISYSQSIEEVSYSIPKTVYFGGEKVWISGQVTQDESEEKSIILYAELINRYNESVAIAKIPLEDSQSFNFLQLPQDLPSDNYLLRVFTRISPHQSLEKGISQQFITVFNRLAPPDVVGEREEFDFENPNSSSKIKITSNELNPGENLSVDISAITGVEEISISVLNPFLANQDKIESSMIYESIDSKNILPELFGHIIEAKVEGESLDTTQLYYVSIHGEKSALLTDRPDTNGSLFFDAGGMKNWKYLVAQADGNKSLIDFNLVSSAPKTHFKDSFSFPVLVISPADEPFLKELLKGGQIEGYFVHEYEAYNDPVVTGLVEDRVYELDDYTRFETVETVIKEYVPEVSVKTVQKKKEFRAINEVGNFSFDSNPLMLIDAMPVFDSDELAKFDPKGLKTLEILTRTFYLNEEEFPGVLSFSSYKNDFGGFQIPTNGIYVDYEGIQPKIASANSLFDSPDKEDQIMDWRTILYWSKSQKSTPISNSFDIKVPEIKSKFMISVKSNGEIFTKLFEVK
ncbi:hypothetical protein AAGF08_17005 [Algoriphagus sp. SE2]|uniref:hypothetical protein n=1 Tax=Algoriphagus sp. SE2 TaxID=3141536 RepID=UPI0031CDA700